MPVPWFLVAAGLVEQWRKMYCSSEWVSGQTTATILATIGGTCWWCEPVFKSQEEQWLRDQCSWQLAVQHHHYGFAVNGFYR